MFLRRNLQALLIGASCIASSFAIGIQTASDVHPISLIEAGSSTVRGDLNGNGEIDERDVILVLEIAEGYTEATPEQLRADPNGDGQLTVDDALRLLHLLSLR